MMKSLILAVFVALMAGCAGVVKVEGDQVVNGRLAVKVSQAWNKVDLPGSKQPFEGWTQEGISLDHLRFWAGVKPGSNLITVPAGSVPAGQKAPRVPTFTAGMTLDQLVNLFEVLYAVDGSIVTVIRVEPSQFGGEKGVRFEFSVLRKNDNVAMLGTGWVALRKGDMFAAAFVAPKLSFYSRLLPMAESVVRTALIRD